METMQRMKTQKGTTSHNSSREATNSNQNDHLSKIHYIQPISQKKHAELGTRDKVKINPFTKNERGSSKKEPGQFQGEITFGD